MKNYCVYKHTFPNGKVYIGITCENPKDRWKKDGSGYLTKKKNGEYRQPLMAYAVIKYGWDSVEHEILFSGLIKEEAESKEQELIAKYKSNNRDFGYNIANGGSVNQHSEETKRKISEAQKGKKRGPTPEETKEKIRKANTGKHPSEEIRKRMSEGKKGKSNGQEKPVICIETGIIYSSLKEAEEKTGIFHSNISKVCNNKGLKTTGGYHWQYYIAGNITA